jgi:hypothetical protein
LEKQAKQQEQRIKSLEANLHQADQETVQQKVRETEMLQANTKLLSENQLMKQQLKNIDQSNLAHN